MKKVIGFLFLLLANFALLAHTVIPHHHHDEDVVTICYHISSENSISHDHINQHSPQDIGGHAHGNNGLGDTCVLNELYIRSSSGDSSSSEDEENFDFIDFATLISVFCYDLNSFTTMCDGGEQSFMHKPFIFSSYNQYVTRSLGLRAPPVC